MHDVIGQDDHEWFVAHCFPGRQHCVAQPQRLFLNHEGDFGDAGGVKHLVQQSLLTVLGQPPLQRRGRLEVGGDAFLAGSGDYDYFLDSTLGGFFHDVLKHRAVKDGEKFLGDRLGHRQKPGTQTGSGNYGFLDGHNQPPADSTLLV